ncbi:MAG: copper-binding protein [Bryobacteraceae bacterium]
MLRIVAALCVLLASLGCSKPKAGGGPTRQYLLSGKIIRINERSHVVTVQHGPIRSASGQLWMEAMTMDFPVRDPAGFTKLKVGLKIRATVKQQDDDYDYWIEAIEVE